jgi:hypothetical protein
MTITCVIDSMLESRAAAAAAPEKDKGTGEAQQQPAAKLATSFPAGLRVLLVDDDPVCLMVIGQMLRACQYEGERAPRQRCVPANGESAKFCLLAVP